MPKFPQGGRVRVSTSTPPLFESQRPISSETKYYGLIRDNALSDIEEPLEALSEVLRDIQNPSEAATLGTFTATDLQIITGITRFNLKKEDFEVIENASINIEDENGNLSPQISPRQRIVDRIKQTESFAGRGTVYQGQGTVLFKYVVPTDEKDGSDELYSHTNPPPFFTEDIDSTATNAPDDIPSLTNIDTSHRVGVITDGTFVPDKEYEYWWSGQYLTDVRDRAEYPAATSSALDNPTFPILRDGNMGFSEIVPSGITQETNWGLRFDTWFKASHANSKTFLRFAAFVNGHLRIDYFEKTGYNSSGKIQGSWKTALDTSDPTKYYYEDIKERPISDGNLPYARRYVQGGPSTAFGEGNGTAHVRRTDANGGAWNLYTEYEDKDSNEVQNFNDDYVPIVIRFWYGQKDTTTDAGSIDEIDREPYGPPGVVLDYITTDASDITLWNDYSSQMRIQYNSANDYWERIGGDDTDFSNFHSSFELLGYSSNATQPTELEDYFTSPQLIVVSKDGDPPSNTAIKFSIPGLTVADGNTLWVILKNRPWSQIPGSRSGDELWQRYLFNPNPTKNYENVKDMLDGVGSNYVEPDPSKEVFDLNYSFYQAKYGNLPALGTYGPDRYDGFIPTTLTSSSGVRDYDYDHGKLLMIGRQKKGTTADIGDGFTKNQQVSVVDSGDGTGNQITSASLFPNNNFYYIGKKIEFLTGDGGSVDDTRFIIAYNGSTKTVTFNGANKTSQSYYINVINKPKVGQDLATGETRNKGENYTFIEVVENEAGFGGEVIINAYPTNNMSVLSTTNTGQFNKFLNMSDNTATYSNSNRQGITNLSPVSFPNDTEYAADDRLEYRIIGGNGTLRYVDSAGNPDDTGKISQQLLGAPVADGKSDQIKSLFITDFQTDGGTKYSFYGPVGATRGGFENQKVTVNAGGQKITNSGLFPNNGDTGNNDQYIGTQIQFLSGDAGSVADTRYVTSYDASTETVTFSDNAKDAGNFYVNVWYNHFTLGGEFPTKVVNTSGNNTSNPIKDNDELQVTGTFNAGYQFSKVDGGAGLNFAETLFIKQNTNPSGSSPFTDDTEAPAPPADIVTPFGYDNTPSSSDPGLGGLCYPPYSIQNIELQYLAKTDADLYGEAEGDFDVWWGGRNVSLSNLGNKSLTVTDKLLFDFDPADSGDLISTLASNKKPVFTGSEYTHKLEVELNVGIPAGPAGNSNLYQDVIRHSNGSPTKDKFYLFINKSGSDLEVVSENKPDWTT